MCAAVSSQVSPTVDGQSAPLTPGQLLRREINNLFKTQRDRIATSHYGHGLFRTKWKIDLCDTMFGCISDRGDSRVVRTPEVVLTPKPEEENGKTYIAKIFRKQMDVNGIKELTILTFLKNNNVSNIPSVIDASWDRNNRECILIFEDLHTRVHKAIYSLPVLPLESIGRMATSVLRTLIDLTSIHPDLKHGDIKVENIMAKNEQYWLIDWREMCVERDVNLNRLTTIRVRPPEGILGYNDHGAEIDTWSFIITVFEIGSMTHFSPVVYNEEELEQLHAICQRTEQSIPRTMQQDSPVMVRDKFFDQKGNLREPNSPYLPCPPFSASLRRRAAVLIEKFPDNQERIAAYFNRLILFVQSLLIIDPSMRPRDHRETLQSFRDAGLG